MKFSFLLRRFFALILSMGLILPGGPAFALRSVEINEHATGLEELEDRLKEGQPVSLKPGAGLEEGEELNRQALELIGILDSDVPRALRLLKQLPERERIDIRSACLETLTQMIEDLAKEKIFFKPAYDLTSSYAGEYTVEGLNTLKITFYKLDLEVSNQEDYQGEYLSEAGRLDKLLTIRGTKEYLLRLKLIWFLVLPDNGLIVHPASGVDYVPAFLFPYIGMTLGPFSEMDPLRPIQGLPPHKTGVDDPILNGNLERNAHFYTEIDALDVSKMAGILQGDPFFSDGAQKIVLLKRFGQWTKASGQSLGYLHTRYRGFGIPDNFLEVWAQEMDEKFLKEGDLVLLEDQSDELEGSFVQRGYRRINYPRRIQERLRNSEPKSDVLLGEGFSSFVIEWPRTWRIFQKPFSVPGTYVIDPISGSHQRMQRIKEGKSGTSSLGDVSSAGAGLEEGDERGAEKQRLNSIEVSLAGRFGLFQRRARNQLLKEILAFRARHFTPALDTPELAASDQVVTEELNAIFSGRRFGVVALAKTSGGRLVGYGIAAADTDDPRTATLAELAVDPANRSSFLLFMRLYEAQLRELRASGRFARIQLFNASRSKVGDVAERLGFVRVQDTNRYILNLAEAGVEEAVKRSAGPGLEEGEGKKATRREVLKVGGLAAGLAFSSPAFSQGAYAKRDLAQVEGELSEMQSWEEIEQLLPYWNIKAREKAIRFRTRREAGPPEESILQILQALSKYLRTANDLKEEKSRRMILQKMEKTRKEVWNSLRNLDLQLPDYTPGRFHQLFFFRLPSLLAQSGYLFYPDIAIHNLGVEKEAAVMPVLSVYPIVRVERNRSLMLWGKEVSFDRVFLGPLEKVKGFSLGLIEEGAEGGQAAYWHNVIYTEHASETNRRGARDLVKGDLVDETGRRTLEIAATAEGTVRIMTSGQVPPWSLALQAASIKGSEWAQGKSFDEVFSAILRVKETHEVQHLLDTREGYGDELDRSYPPLGDGLEYFKALQSMSGKRERRAQRAALHHCEPVLAVWDTLNAMVDLEAGKFGEIQSEFRGETASSHAEFYMKELEFWVNRIAQDPERYRFDVIETASVSREDQIQAQIWKMGLPKHHALLRSLTSSAEAPAEEIPWWRTSGPVVASAALVAGIGTWVGMNISKRKRWVAFTEQFLGQLQAVLGQKEGKTIFEQLSLEKWMAKTLPGETSGTRHRAIDRLCTAVVHIENREEKARDVQTLVDQLRFLQGRAGLPGTQRTLETQIKRLDRWLAQQRVTERPDSPGGTLPKGTGLEEVAKAWKGVAATPAYAGVQKPFLPLLFPGAVKAAPLVAEAGLEFVLLVDSDAGLEEAKLLLERVGVDPQQYRIWPVKGTDFLAAISEAKREFPDRHIYLVNPAVQPDWLRALLEGLEEIGILPIGGLEEAFQATQRYLERAA